MTVRRSGFTVDGDIIPDADDTRNLGSSSKQFAAIYAVDGYFETAEGEKVEVNNAAGTWRSVEYQTGGSMRWVITADSASESGGNAGSNFQVRRYDDSGSYIDNPIHIYRSDGVVRMVNGAKMDTIEEYTSDTGVTVDGVLIKDGQVDGVDISAHASRHQNGGADELDLTGLEGDNIKVDTIGEKTPGAGVSFGSVVDFGHAVTREVKTLSLGDYTITDSDPDLFFLDNPGDTDSTITLPTAADNKGRILRFVVRSPQVGANNWILDGEGTETINGDATYTLSAATYDRVTIACDGSNWFILAEQ